MKKLVILTSLVGCLVACPSAFGWGSGHDTVARAVRLHLSAEENAYLEDPAHMKAYLHAAHLPDLSEAWSNDFTQADRDLLLSRGEKGTYALHFRHGYWFAFTRLVEAIRAKDTGRILMWKMSIGHTLADMTSCNHDPLIHIADYGWGPRGSDVLRLPMLDLRWVETREDTKKAFFDKAAALEIPAVDPEMTLEEALLVFSGYESEGLINFRDQVKLLEAAAELEANPSDAAALRYGEQLGALGLWGTRATVRMIRIAEMIAARGDALDYDQKALDAKSNEEWAAYTKVRPITDDEMVRPFLPNGRPSRIRVLYDPLGRFGSGPITILDRFISVNVAGALKAIAPEGNPSVIDIRELHDRGVDPAETPVLIVFGTYLTNWGYLKADVLRDRIREYAKAGGRLIWVGGNIHPGLADDVRKAIQTAPKDSYCKPSYPIPFADYLKSTIVWTGSDRKGEWTYHRRPNGDAGWHWKGSRESFVGLPETAKPILEIVPPTGDRIVYGVATPKDRPNFVYLPTAVLYPYVLTEEKPVLKPLSLRLDSAGEFVLRESLKLLE